MVMIVVVIAVSSVTPFARFLQIVTTGLRLAAVLTVLALGIVQSALRIADSLLALPVIVVIAVKRLCGDRSAQEREHNQRRNERSGLLKHASSSDCTLNLTFFGCILGVLAQTNKKLLI